MLVATLTFDDEDPDLHVHFTAHARQLDVEDPAEFARVLGVLQESLTAYTARVALVRASYYRALANTDG